MTTALDRILEYKAGEVRTLKALRSLSSLQNDAKAQPAPRGFAAAMTAVVRGDQNALICEIKRKSPSAGEILIGADAAEVARDYEKGGAACLSVLTDAPSFQGAPEFLTAARGATRLPALRKDFLYDVYQVYEARAWGADCILIIMAAVDDETAKELNKAAHDLRMDVLVEVHNEQELERALRLEAKLIGINNRDLHTFNTTLEVSEKLAPKVPAGHIVVGESGIATHDDCVRLARAGVRAFLVGESLMRQKDVTQATHDLLHGAPIKAK